MQLFYILYLIISVISVNIYLVIELKKLIMTDLDCTLLPMDQDLYIQRYVSEIAKLFNENGYDGKAIAKATMKASTWMLKNDGSRTNKDAFEEAFKAIIKEDADKIIEIFEQVYSDRYEVIKSVTQENPYAKEIVSLMREKAKFVVVATQPMFPIEAVRRRLSWIGLTEQMFDYITVYDNSSFSKPSVGYYKEIMDRFGVSNKETLMIGNDVNEDILPCKALMVDTFLVTEGLINIYNHDITGITKGTYKDLIDYLKSI